MPSNDLEFKELKKLIQEKNVFDKKYYLKRYKDARESRETAINHFCKIGIQEHRDPNKEFDTLWYKDTYKDIEEGFNYPLVHFLLYGKKENRFMNATEKKEYEEELVKGFDVEFYINSHDDLKAIESDEFDFLLQYIRFGRDEGRVFKHGVSAEEVEVETQEEAIEEKPKKAKQKKSSKAMELIANSKMFDASYYLEHYPDAKESEMTLLEHFCNIGLKEDRKPNAEFDPVWYREHYKDVEKSNIVPFVHYVEYGSSEGRYQSKTELPKFGPLHHNPLVSLIAVNFNGASDLPDFLLSVSKQSYKNFELIIIDNNSKDNSEDIVNSHKHLFKNIKFIQSGKNLGFAAGNNYALPYCNGELLYLINVDTIVDKEWLKEAVDAMAVDRDCAAVASKTLFFERFQDIEFNNNKEFSINIEKLVESLEYKKYFIRYGNLVDGSIQSKENKIIVSLPIQENPITIVATKESLEKSNLSYKVGKNKTHNIEFSDKEVEFSIEHSEDDTINSSYIINNAGSFKKNNMPADRGFGEYDNGQYDSKCYVEFVCGVSVLLRRSTIVDRKIFVSEFFAYYEDSELSRWLNDQGYKILYAPRSVLYHQHSVTSTEGSPLWSLLVTRSKNIYNYNGDCQELFNTNSSLEESFKHNIDENLYKVLKLFSVDLKNRLEKENDIVEKLTPVAIYNSYWMTKGGGESHALSFAQMLQKHRTVYLVSEFDFDIQELEAYYHMDLSNCRKIVESEMTPEFTSKFDLFINSTYRSNLNSLARKSYYIVSFPHIDIDKTILDSYTFVYNSDYTQKWAHKLWRDNLSEDLVYPLGMINTKGINKKNIGKEKLILSVGRFFVAEHSKNQHIIAQAYKKMVESDENFSNWKLVLIGSLNISSHEDVEYIEKIKKTLYGLNYELIINADRKSLNSYFEKAYIYVHASGYGHNPDTDPNKFEHFGITPVEAMAHGCILVVYHVGAPAELTAKLGVGYRYETVDALIDILTAQTKDINNGKAQKIMKTALEFIEENRDPKKINNWID